MHADIIIGDSTLSVKFTKKLFRHQILVTNISYPIIPRGADELHIQLNAHHTPANLVGTLAVVGINTIMTCPPFVAKYNVVETQNKPWDGEYEVQTGFSWTNGVYMALQDHLSSN